MWRFSLCLVRNYFDINIFNTFNSSLVYYKIKLFYILQVCITISVSASKFNVEQTMKNHQVVPDVIPVAPKEILQVNEKKPYTFLLKHYVIINQK